METYKFIKTGRDWYIDLPSYIEQGGDSGDLQMIDGADKMLDIIAEGGNEVVLTISREQFEGADKLILTEKCDPFIGGGNYLLKTYNGQNVNQNMWLCQVTEFVFGDIPAEIYVEKDNKVFAR